MLPVTTEDSKATAVAASVDAFSAAIAGGRQLFSDNPTKKSQHDSAVLYGSSEDVLHVPLKQHLRKNKKKKFAGKTDLVQSSGGSAGSNSGGFLLLNLKIYVDFIPHVFPA